MHLEVVNSWRDLSPDRRGASVAIGSFDGVHHGHRRVIAEAARAASELGLPLTAMSFEPPPRAALRPDAAPSRLMTLDQQARAMDALGVDAFYVLPFDAQAPRFTDEEFARELLKGGLAARHVAAAFEVPLGGGCMGDLAALSRFGDNYGFSVSPVKPVGGVAGKCSSAVRAALRAGQPDCARQILGRPFAIEGVVVEGQHLGRQLGYPTANVAAGDYVRPKFGVYATLTRLADGRELPGVANFGENPTTGLVDARLEVWLFDFDEDIYGQTIETDLVAFLRPELKFSGLASLTEQIRRDAAQARAILTPEIRRGQIGEFDLTAGLSASVSLAE